MKKSEIKFAEVQSLLKDMGFSRKRDKIGWRFEHDASYTIFLFRAYLPSHRVYENDLFLMRSQLSQRGLTTDQAFDEFLAKSPA